MNLLGSAVESALLDGRTCLMGGFIQTSARIGEALPRGSCGQHIINLISKAHNIGNTLLSQTIGTEIRRLKTPSAGPLEPAFGLSGHVRRIALEVDEERSHTITPTSSERDASQR